MFSSLSNTDLVKTYLNAKKYELDEDFLSLLADEIRRRGIDIEKEEMV